MSDPDEWIEMHYGGSSAEEDGDLAEQEDDELELSHEQEVQPEQGERAEPQLQDQSRSTSTAAGILRTAEREKQVGILGKDADKVSWTTISVSGGSNGEPQ